MLVRDPRELVEVGEEFDAVAVPHGELPFDVASIRPPCGRVPGPDLVRIEGVEALRDVTERRCVAGEVAVDVVGVNLVLNERAVQDNLVNSYLPQLPHKNLRLVDQL